MLQRIKYDTRTSHFPNVKLRTMVNIPPKLSGMEKGADVYLLIHLDGTGVQSVLKNLPVLKRNQGEYYPSFISAEITDLSEPGPDGQFLRNILCLMDAHIDDDQFGIKEVCAAMGMCRAQIYRKFKLFIGKTPHDFLRTYRLQKAKQLLLSTKLNVSEIAYLTGFKNVSHFSRIFSHEFGKNPSSFIR